MGAVIVVGRKLHRKYPYTDLWLNLEVFGIGTIEQGHLVTVFFLIEDTLQKDLLGQPYIAWLD